MKIILKKDFDLLGNEGEITEVKNGYARNYLIPNGIAVMANESNLKSFNEIKRQKSKKVQKLLDEAKKFSSQLSNQVLTIPVKTGEDNKIFGSVTSQMIYDNLVNQGYEGIDRKRIIIREPIKSLGEHEVELKLHQTVIAKIKINVVDELKNSSSDQTIIKEETPVEEN